MKRDPDRAALRRVLLARRDSTSADMLEIASEAVRRRLRRWPPLDGAGSVGVYHSVGSEIRTGGIIQDVLDSGRTLLLPAIADDSLEFRAVRDERDLAPGPFGVREPRARCAASVPDVVVVSATPGDALQREWEEHRLDGYVRGIAGQEMGSKSEHLKQAAAGKYAPDHILMVGDAPGDWRAAQTVEARFFPIVPGSEEECWQRLQDEALARFFAGTYAGAYETAQVEKFQRLLPEQPPWTESAAGAAG